MSAVANTTPIVTTVTKIVNKEKTQKERVKVNIQDFYEEHYDDILPIIMDKVRRNKRKEVHTRLDFAESFEKDVDPGARGNGGKVNLHHPADMKVAPVTRAIGSQEIKGARRWRKTWSYLGAARMWISLHLEFITSEARGRRECPTT
ncbi:hypothetical protein Tco_1479062 [Tanacetum coccineum]